MKEDKIKISKIKSLLKNDLLYKSSIDDFKPKKLPKNTNFSNNHSENIPYKNINEYNTENKVNVIKQDNLQLSNEKTNEDLIETILAYLHPDRERTQREKLFISFITNFFYALSNLMIKFITINYPEAKADTLSLYRFIVMFLLTYIYVVKRNVNLIEVSQIQSKYKLAIRILSAYTIAYSLGNSVHYLRLGTAISFFFITPIFTSLASIYFFKDKCKTQNVIGLTVCIISMLMITNSESIIEKENKNVNLSLGLFWGICSLISTVAMIITTKMLVDEIDSINLNYLIGKYSTIIGLIVCIITNSLFYIYPGYILLTSLNGLFYWCALYLMNLSLKINNLIATSCISFLSLVYAYGFGFIIFGETIRFIDLIASLFIFGFNIYSIIYPPPEEKLSELKENLNNDINKDREFNIRVENEKKNNL